MLAFLFIVVGSFLMLSKYVHRAHQLIVNPGGYHVRVYLPVHHRRFHPDRQLGAQTHVPEITMDDLEARLAAQMDEPIETTLQKNKALLAGQPPDTLLAKLRLDIATKAVLADRERA